MTRFDLRQLCPSSYFLSLRERIEVRAAEKNYPRPLPQSGEGIKRSGDVTGNCYN